MHRLAHNFNRHTIRKDEDGNPKILPLAKLVDQIDPQLLSYYLEQIAAFLKNTKKDLWFPLIAPDLDAFLVRMIKDEQNLRELLGLFDEKSRGFAEDILQTLRENEGVYKLVHNYDNSKANKNILVYKKIYMDRTADSYINQFQRMCPLKCLDIEDSNVADASLDDPSQPKWLNATLRFARDSDMTSIEFPDMTIEEAEEVAAAFRGAGAGAGGALGGALAQCRDSCDFRMSFLHTDGGVRLVVEKVALNNNKNERRGQSTPEPVESELTKTQRSYMKKKQMIENIGSPFINCALETILDFLDTQEDASLKFRNANEDQCLFIQSACSMAKSKRLHSLFEPGQQALMRKIGVLLASAQYDLKVDVAKMEKDTKLRTVSIRKEPKELTNQQSFVKNQSEASYADNSSMESSSTASSELKSPQPSTSANSQPHTSSTKPQSIDNAKIIDKAIDQATKAIDKGKAKDTTGIAQKVDNLAKTMDKTREVLEKAIENAKAKEDKGLDLGKVIEQVTVVGKGNIPLDINQTNVKRAETIAVPSCSSRSTDKEMTKTIDIKDKGKIVDSIKITVQMNPTDNARPSTSTGASTSGIRTIVKEHRKSIDSKESEGKVPTEQSDGRPLPARKAKLLEAMSVPVESDIATRMMLQMGWEGGPLGLRGEGIMEPIVPALHLTAGAGLGHVKPKPPPPSTKSKNFRMDVLKNIHLLVIEPPLKRTVLYPNQIGKKERGFLLTAVKTFTSRGNLAVNDEELQALVTTIMEEMICEPKLKLSIVLHEDKRSVTLSKNDVQMWRTVHPAPQTSATSLPAESVMTLLPKLQQTNHITSELVASLGRQLVAGASSKAARSLGQRVAVLGKLLQLAAAAPPRLALTFDCTLTLRQVNYVKELISSLNSGGRPSYGPHENHLIAAVVDALGPAHIAYEFGNLNRTLTLTKTSPSKTKPSNSAKKQEVAQKKDKSEDNEQSDKVVNVTGKTCDNKIFDVKKLDSGDVIYISSDSDLTDAETQEILKKSDKLAKDLDVRFKNANSSLDSILEEIDYKDFEKISLSEKGDGKVLKGDKDESSSSKRLRSDSDGSNKDRKKTKLQIPKYLCIAPDSYPLEEVSLEMVQAFQNMIRNQVENNSDKPLIECVGLKNGSLVYGCHNELGRILIENVANEMNLKTTNITNLYKGIKKYNVNARINTYLDTINMKKMFQNLEKYNEGLKTDSWTVVDVQKNNGNIEFLIEMDSDSFDYISQNSFALFAGMDRIRFSVIWD